MGEESRDCAVQGHTLLDHALDMQDPIILNPDEVELFLVTTQAFCQGLAS